MNSELPDDLPEWLMELIKQNKAIAKIRVFNGHSVTEIQCIPNRYKCDNDIEVMLESIERANKCMYKELI